MKIKEKLNQCITDMSLALVLHFVQEIHYYMHASISCICHVRTTKPILNILVKKKLSLHVHKINLSQQN